MKYILILFFLFSITLSAKTYTISGGSNNVVHLIASNILKVAYTKAGLDMKPQFMSLDKSLDFSNSGKSDGELARIDKISSMYRNLEIVPVELITVEAMAFSKNKDINISSWSDLKDYNITIVKGAKFIEAGTKNIKKNVVTNFQDAINYLKTDKTEIIVIPKLAGLKIIFENNYMDIAAVSTSLKSLKLYHFVNKKNSHLIPILTPILQKMKKSGEISYWRNAYLNSISK